MQQNNFSLSSEAKDAIDELKSNISTASLCLPDPKDGPLLLETDASGTAIGAALSQSGRPIAFFSRTLNPSERNHSIVEREAMAIVEAVRKWQAYIQSFHCIIKTDQQSVAFLFSNNKSKIKNEKLSRWRLELSEFNLEISYRPGPLNKQADALSRTTAAMKPSIDLNALHNVLAHPGVARFWEYVQRYKLPYSLEEVREVVGKCETCCHCKPKFFKPTLKAHIIKATQPFERLSMDIIGPKEPSKSGKCDYLHLLMNIAVFHLHSQYRTLQQIQSYLA